MPALPSNHWDDFTHVPLAGPAPEHVLQSLRAFQELFARLPHKQLIRQGWLESADDPSPLARVFFDLQAGRNSVFFRKNATADDSLIAVWLAHIRGEAEHHVMAKRVPAFAGMDAAALREIAESSVDVAVLPTLNRLLGKRGIILVYASAIPGMKLDGAVFRLGTGQAVVAMSLRFARLDNFWFTLLHELAHLVLHWDKLDQPVLVDVEIDEADVAEKAANRMAKDAIVDRSAWRNAPPKYRPGDRAVLVAFARKVRMHPALLAGLLRREMNRYTIYSDIVNEHDVRAILNLPS